MVADQPARNRDRRDQLERQWRELAGAGRSQLTAGAALRARDADQPTPAELAQAEEELVLQRRNWKPA